MGLTTWENTPDGKILKSDVIIAKNYLNEQEIKNLDIKIIKFIAKYNVIKKENSLTQGIFIYLNLNR